MDLIYIESCLNLTKLFEYLLRGYFHATVEISFL